MNNKHIEKGMGASYNGTYKGQQSLINKYEAKGGRRTRTVFLLFTSVSAGAIRRCFWIGCHNS